MLVNYDWPGNIRELRNAIERIMILAEENRVAAKYLPIRISEGGAAALPAARREGNGLFTLPPGGASLHEIEGEILRQALEQARGNKTKAAKLLRISRDTLRYKVKKHKLG